MSLTNHSNIDEKRLLIWPLVSWKVANVEVSEEEWDQELKETFTQSGLFPGISQRHFSHGYITDTLFPGI